jgi:group I intron endonuclease
MTYAETTRAGIYEIRNSVTGDAYYGSAVNLRRRSQTHASALRNGRHGNPRLQNAWKKYGEDAFTFSVLAVLERSEALPTERRLLAKRFGADGCMNISPKAGAPMAGRKHTRETIERIRRASTGKTHSPETLQRMSDWQKGRTCSPEERDRLASVNVGRRRSAASRGKQSLTLRKKWEDGYRHSPEALAKMSAASKGRRLSDEARERMSQAQSARWARARKDAAA